jgi:hypothetical protein
LQTTHGGCGARYLADRLRGLGLEPYEAAIHDKHTEVVRFLKRGIEHAITAGNQPIFERGEHTGAMPGRLVRAGRNGAALEAAMSAAG